MCSGEKSRVVVHHPQWDTSHIETNFSNWCSSLLLYNLLHILGHITKFINCLSTNLLLLLSAVGEMSSDLSPGSNLELMSLPLETRYVCMSMMFRLTMLLHCWPILITLSIYLCIALCVVTKWCKIGIWCIEVEQECAVNISIGTTFNPKRVAGGRSYSER